MAERICAVCNESESANPAFAGLHRYGPTDHDFRARFAPCELCEREWPKHNLDCQIVTDFVSLGPITRAVYG